MRSSDQITNNATSSRKLINLVVLSSIVFSGALCFYFAYQPTSTLAPSEELREDPEAMVKLKEIVDAYKVRKKERLEERGTTDIFRQEDLEIFNDFIEEYYDTDTALTAKMITAEELIMYAVIPDLELPKSIYKEIVHNYPDRWQGKVAKAGLVATEIHEVDSNFEGPNHRITIASEST